MKKKLLFLLAIPIDLIYEIWYQWMLSKNMNGIHGSYCEKIYNSLLEKPSINLHSIIHHNIHHRINHLCTELFLVLVSFGFFYLCSCDSFLDYLHKRFIGSFLFLGKFMTVNNFDIKIMELEQLIIVFLECNDLPGQFGKNKFISYGIFIVVLTFVIVPLIVRAKVFLELKLKIISPVIIAICTILIVKAFRIFIVFLGSAMNFCKCIRIDKQHYPVLDRFCKDNNIYFDAYYYINTFSSSPTLFFDFFNITKVLIYNDIKLFSDREVESALLFEANKRTFYGIIGNIFLPFLPKIITAIFMIYFSKTILEGFCGLYISHVTAFLIAEETFSFAFEKILSLPITLLETQIDNFNYDFIKKKGFGEDFSRFLIISAIHDSTESFKSSNIYSFFHREKNLFEKIRRLL